MEDAFIQHIENEINLMEEKRAYVTSLAPQEFTKLEPTFKFEEHDGWKEITKRETLNEIDREIVNRRNQIANVQNARDEKEYNEKEVNKYD